MNKDKTIRDILISATSAINHINLMGIESFHDTFSFEDRAEIAHDLLAISQLAIGDAEASNHPVHELLEKANEQLS